MPRFEVVRRLGSGGGGLVRLVHDRAQGGVLRALKTLAPGAGGGGEEERRSRAALLREARILSALRHPGVPRLIDVGATPGGAPWLLLEYVPPPPPVPEAEAQRRLLAAATARGLLDVLAYLHRYGWLHRDVKPSNVIASGPVPTDAARWMRVVLLDYGLATREDEATSARGTLPFVAPEVLQGEDADPRSDLFGAGAALLALAAPVTFAPDVPILPESVPDDALLPADWLRCLLQQRRDRRPESAERALADLDAALGRGAAPRPRAPLPRAPVPAGRSAEIETIARGLTEPLTTVVDVVPDGPAEMNGETPGEVPGDDAASASEGIAHAGLFLVRGESGVGKSRLVSELRLRAAAAGWSTLWGSCSEQRDEPLPGVGRVLEGALLVAQPGSGAVRRRGRAVRAFAAGGLDAADPEDAAAFLMDVAGETRGLLVVVEDLQDATVATMRTLAAIARAVADEAADEDAPRVVLVGALTDGIPLTEEIDAALRAVVAEGLVKTLPLRPLGEADIQAVVRGALGPRAPADRVAEVLRQQGGALPLFAEEILAHLVREGTLRHDGLRWTLAARQAPTLPQTLLGAMRARIEALPERERMCVQLLAIHELPAPRARLERMTGGDAAATIAAAESSGLVVPAAEEDHLALVHAIVAQAAASMLQPAERTRLHDVVASALPRTDPEFAVMRAYHVSRGSDVDLALAAATETARKLRDDGEPGRAASFVRQALRLLPEQDPRIPRLRRSLAELLVESGRPEAAANVQRDLLSSEQDPEVRVKLLLGLAEALDASGLPAETKAVCRDALAILDARGRANPEGAADRLTALARIARAQRGTGELREAIETIKAALALAGRDQIEERVSLLSLLGNVYVQLGDLQRAKQFHESCVQACTETGRRRGLATALHNLGVVHARLGLRADALRCYQQSLRLARRAKDFTAVAQTLANLGVLRAEDGDLAAAERLLLRSLALRRRTGDRAGTAFTLGNAAGLLRARGRLGRALATLLGAIRELRAAGDVEGEARFLVQAASIHLFAGDAGGARPLLQRCIQLAQGASLRGIEAGAELLLGRLERRIDPLGEAWAQHLARSVALSELVGDAAATAEALLETALGERDRNRRGTALRAWRRARALLDGTGAADVVARADLVRGRLEAGRAPGEEAIAALERFRAYAVATGRRDYLPSALLCLGRARLEAGDAAAAAVLLAEAEEVEEDVTASLPPTLRRVRETSPVRGLLARLREAAENAGGGRGAGSAVSAAGGRSASGERGQDGDDMDQERLLKLLEINKQLNQAQDMRALLDTIMDIATETTGAERGFLLVVDDSRITFQAARNFKREEVAKPELKISSSIVKRVLKSGAPLLTDNAREDERFAEFKSVERLELKSILSVPFRVGNQVMGALYLDNPARKGAFGPGDLQFLTALGDQAALAIRNLRHAEQMAQLAKQLQSNLEVKSRELEVASRALAERATKYPYDEIVGVSAQLREVLLLLDKVVDTDVPVLIQGESGTGKELIARAIHKYGRRKDGPFVPVNCGAITESLLESEFFGHVRGSFTGATGDKKGLFEAANGGTIFLDEIGEMSQDMQKKLLRVLQEREVRPVGGKTTMKIDVRVIAATNRDLRQMTTEGRFREDLYYRIAVIGITMPPLRDRADDIPAIVGHCMKRATKELGLAAKPIDDDAMEAMTNYAWPGNVRELDNEVKKALTLSGERITLKDLSPQVAGAHEAHGPEPALVGGGVAVEIEGGKLKDNLERTEKALIERALEKNHGNQTRAAKDLGISRVWLRKKMEKYGLLPSA